MAVLPYMVKLITGCLNKWGSHRVHAPIEKVGIKNLKVTHKTLLLGKNCCSAMKMKESNNLHLRVHPVIANIELIF